MMKTIITLAALFAAVANGQSSVVQQQPATVVQQQPATVVQQQPATVVQQQPATVVQQQPATVVQPSTGSTGGQPSGQLYTFAASISATSPNDIKATTGTTKVRTQNGDTLFFESTLFNAVDITAVHIHLSPGNGAIDGGPLVLALTNTSASVGLAPLSSSGSNPIVQTGSRTTANLLASPALAAARQKLVDLGFKDNLLQNIGDIDRLLRAGVLYSDVHSLTRPSPQRVGSGGFFPLPANQGRKMMSN